MTENLKKNYAKNKSEILLEVGTILIGIISILGAFLPKVFGNKDPLLSLFITGMVALCFPSLKNITARVFGVKQEKAIDEITENYESKIHTRDETIARLINENIELKIQTQISEKTLNLEQTIAEWQLKACASNDNYRQAILSNENWINIERKKAELYAKQTHPSSIPINEGSVPNIAVIQSGSVEFEINKEGEIRDLPDPNDQKLETQ